jgi:outer membrane protein OmpA-like peptidoglycan-associated protein
VAANNVEDRFNAKFNDNSDWQFTAQLGLLWRFGQKYKQCQKVEQPQNLTLYQQMLKTVDERMKQWRQRMKDENNRQLSDKDIDAQRLQYVKDVSTEMAGNRINRSLNNVSYDQEAEVLTLHFNDMPSISLWDVPSSCLPHFENVDNVRFQNTVYNLRPDDTFEVLYTEVLDSQGHKFIYRKGDNGSMKQKLSQPVAPVQPQTNTQAVADRLNETIYYELRESDPKGNDAVMRRVADYMRRNPEAKVAVVGYADRETGSPRVNAGYARQRAQKAKTMLVKQYGCDAKRISATSKGDTEQPFSENAKNRCVIITGEGK